MKLTKLVLAASLATGAAAAQTPSPAPPDLQAEIHQTLWKPFVAAINQQDLPAFLALHAPDLTRVERREKRISTLSQYRERLSVDWKQWHEQLAQQKSQYRFDLRVTETVAGNSTAFQTGYFRNEIRRADGTERTSYGQFHVLLRQTGGQWKIVLDSDTPVTAEQAAAAFK